MQIKSRKPLLGLAPVKAGFALAGVLPLLVAAHAQAVEFSFADGEVTGSVDSTVSYGQLWRVQGRDKTNDDVNTNDGNRNFDTGLVSEVYKITTDLEATYQNYGAFVRGTAFYDTQIMDKRNDNTDTRPSQTADLTTTSTFTNNDRFTYETRHAAGRSAEILDAYVYGNWDIGDLPLTAKLGRQVFNWGEGVFYRGGINTTNPVDAAKFRLPGSELKEVLVPVEALNFSFGLTENLSMETFYQWNWKETAIDPVGTYFAETDLFAAGGNRAYTEVDALSNPLFQTVYNGAVSGTLPGVKKNFAGLQGTDYLDKNGVIKVADIGSDLNAKDDGQFGLALRYVAEELNSTEFGFYMVNYHAKEPTIYAEVDPAYAGINIDQLAGLGALLGVRASSYDDLVAQAGAGNAAAAQVLSLVNGASAVDVANQVTARREYAEDIRMYGMSFNTTLGEASVFGEMAYRPNLPIGVATTNDLLGDLLGQAALLADGRVVNIGGSDVTITDQIRNSARVEAFNTSLGTIYNFGPTLSFDSLFGVAELASEHLRADSLQYLAYNGDVRYYAGRPNGSYVSGYEREDQVNRNSYGYTLVLSGTWNDVYAGVNLSPFAVYKDDFQGNSHQTGNFIEGRKAYTLGMRASYQNALEAELQYTEFYGAGQNNSGRDRDNVGLNVKYSF